MTWVNGKSRRSIMHRRQPDNRIHPENLGMVLINGKRFVVNLRPGVPFNACIEEFDGALRCWASQNWLDRRASTIVDGFAEKTESGAFVWGDEVKRGPMVGLKGDHPLFKVVFP
jgi:hypothetical protein